MSALVAQPYRHHFATPRVAEFFEIRGLQAQTGQPASRFVDVVIKELMDNGLDAAETARVQPQVDLRLSIDRGLATVVVRDNGVGMDAALIRRICDFSVLVSDKAAYRSPTRGLQGNALKTVLGIPTALGSSEPVVIESRGVRHTIRPSIDPAGAVKIDPENSTIARNGGTLVQVSLPCNEGFCERPTASRWARGFSLFNPHATLSYLGVDGNAGSPVFYKSTVDGTWRKPLPGDPTSAHHYDDGALLRLIFSHVNLIRRGGHDIPVGAFIRTFAGLSSTSKARAVCTHLDGISHLSDFETRHDAVAVLLRAMQDLSRAPKPRALGSVPEAHYRARFEEWYGIERDRFRFKRISTHDGGIPFVVEIAVGATTVPGELFYGINYSPAFDDPLARLLLSAGDITATGSASMLRQLGAYPDGRSHCAAAIHLITPAAAFLDKGKTTLVTS
jgi:DNA topoisomerase VI subunit B